MVEGPLDKVVILLLHRRTPLRPGTLCAGPLGDVVRLPPESFHDQVLGIRQIFTRATPPEPGLNVEDLFDLKSFLSV